MSKKSIVIIFLETILFIGILVGINSFYNRKVYTLDQNLKASRDSIEVVQLRNGNLLIERDAYILKNKELEEVLNITKKERKDLEIKLNDKISYISKIESNIKRDTIEIKDTVIINKDTSIDIKFGYNDDWMSFSGGTYYKDGKSTTSIFDININTPLKVGLTDNYTIFVESENPYLNINNIEGAVIDRSRIHPKPKKWSFSIYGGFGVGYGLIGQQMDIGPQIGGGISYNF